MVFRPVPQGAAAAGAELVQPADNGLAARAPLRGGVPGGFLPQQQPVRGHPQQPAHLGHIGHIRVGLTAFPLANRLPGHPQLLSQLLLRQPGLLPGQGDAFSQ